MELCTTARVHCFDGLCGELIYLVLKPNRDEIAYIVVQEPDPPQLERMVPIELIARATSQDIFLDFSKQYLHYLSPFRQAMFVAEETPVAAPTGWEGGSGLPFSNSRFIPEGSHDDRAEGIAIHRRAVARTKDGLELALASLIVNRDTGRLTHLGLRAVMRSREHRYLIPISEVDYFSEAEIGLKLTQRQMERLPRALASAA
jgi:hypothetical protein